MDNQQTWNTTMNASGNPIMGSLPEPYDYPSPVGLCLAATKGSGVAKMGLWAVIGADRQVGSGMGWNVDIAGSDGTYPFSIEQGTMMSVRYLMMECTWL